MMENEKKELTPKELEELKQFIRTLEKYQSDDRELTENEIHILNIESKNLNVRSMPAEEIPDKPKFIKQGIHSIKQEFGKQLQLSLFNDKILINYNKQFGIKMMNEIEEYGINLNVMQTKLMQGLLKAFTETDYKGNTDSKSREEIMKEYHVFSSDELPPAYKNVREIPRIRIGQRELLRLAGINENNRDSYQDGIKALGYLGTTQFCFYWVRLAYNKDGKPEKDREGDYKKEEVMAVDTLFKVKIVTDEKTDKFMYYEVEPSVIFLDQLKNYFLLIPYDWMQEIEKKVGKRRASSYFFKLIKFLRCQFEEIRRYNNNKSHKDKKPYTIRLSWESLAQTIKMPESIYKRNRARALKMLDEVYQTAQELGYFVSYERTDTVDILELNPDMYPTPDKQLNE